MMRAADHTLPVARNGLAATGLLVAALLGGCTGLPTAQVPSPDLFVLEAKPIAAVANAKRDLVLEVAKPRARPGFDTPQMAYVQRPYELDYFANSRWADTPSRMLAPLFVQALEDSGAFKAVVQGPDPVPADLRVDLELVRLQQDFRIRPSRVELTVQAQLFDLHARRVLATRTFDEIETAPTDDAYGGVTAANAALQRLLQSVATFCVDESGKR
jgi:cholesterol transport system auxiliary component